MKTALHLTGLNERLYRFEMKTL